MYIYKMIRVYHLIFFTVNQILGQVLSNVSIPLAVFSLFLPACLPLLPSFIELLFPSFLLLPSVFLDAFSISLSYLPFSWVFVCLFLHYFIGITLRQGIADSTTIAYFGTALYLLRELLGLVLRREQALHDHFKAQEKEEKLAGTSKPLLYGSNEATPLVNTV